MPIPKKKVVKKVKPTPQQKEERREKHEKTIMKKEFEKEMTYIKHHQPTLTKNEDYLKYTAPIPLPQIETVKQQSTPRFLR
jgi:hypothetical protein